MQVNLNSSKFDEPNCSARVRHGRAFLSRGTQSAKQMKSCRSGMLRSSPRAGERTISQKISRHRSDTATAPPELHLFADVFIAPRTAAY